MTLGAAVVGAIWIGPRDGRVPEDVSEPVMGGLDLADEDVVVAAVEVRVGHRVVADRDASGFEGAQIVRAQLGMRRSHPGHGGSELDQRHSPVGVGEGLQRPNELSAAATRPLAH